ncbi:MAG: antitoxin [Ruminococcus sp.]|nr:antitoxin [Ruminococcus sp.]
MYNEQSKERTMKYMKEKRDKLTLDMPKGKKEVYKKYAESKGKSLTALIMEMLDNEMNAVQSDN